jgi:HSP20 family protein
MDTTLPTDTAARLAAERAGVVVRPDVDVFESADAFTVTADLPGVSPDGVHVDLRDGVLSIDASVAATAPDPSWRQVHRETDTGGFHRRFHLSDRIDASGIRAQMRDGVLTLHLPKSERHRVRRIEVAS